VSSDIRLGHKQTVANSQQPRSRDLPPQATRTLPSEQSPRLQRPPLRPHGRQPGGSAGKQRSHVPAPPRPCWTGRQVRHWGITGLQPRHRSCRGEEESSAAAGCWVTAVKANASAPGSGFTCAMPAARRWQEPKPSWDASACLCTLPRTPRVINYTNKFWQGSQILLFWDLPHDQTRARHTAVAPAATGCLCPPV